METYDSRDVTFPGFSSTSELGASGDIRENPLTSTINRHLMAILDSRSASEYRSGEKQLTIKYDPTLYSSASYLARTNEILMGPSTLLLTEESLRAVVSHEQTHALFSELTADEQGQIVNAFVEYPGELATFYGILRAIYSLDYFSSDRSIARQVRALGVRKQWKIQKRELTYKGLIEDVDITVVIDELLAFSNQNSRAHDGLGEDRFMQTITQLARTIVSLLGGDTRNLLESKGFFSIDPTTILEQLTQDETFTQARQRLQNDLAAGSRIIDKKDRRNYIIDNTSE